MTKRKKKSNISTFLIVFLIILLLLLLLIAFIYFKNPTLIENSPIVTGKQPEPIARSPEISSTQPQIQPKSAVVGSNGTIKVGAFNLQIFGTTKANEPEVLKILSKIIRNYDVIAVQEIRDSSQTALPKLIDAVNSMGNPKYDYVVSERLGRTNSKEQYAYIYSLQTIQQVETPYTYPDSTDMFQREPYISEFKSKNGNFDFVLVTIHTDPDTASQEINDLPKVVEDAKGRYESESDFIIMGDLNAACSYFNERSLSSLKSSEYLWIINDSVDTTTKSTTCAYDRIILTDQARTDFTGNSGVFRFDEAYNT